MHVQPAIQVRDQDSEPPPSALSTDEIPSLGGLEKRLLAPTEHGVIEVATVGDAAARAVARHLLRRARVRGIAALGVDVARLDAPVVDLALRLRAGVLPTEPHAAARLLASVSSGWVVVLLGAPVAGSWDDEVLAHLGELNAHGLFVVVTPEARKTVRAHSRTQALRGDDHDTIRCWWRGILEEIASRSTAGSIGELERWWVAGGSSAPIRAMGAEPLNSAALGLLSRLQLARRAWPEAAIGLLGTIRDVAELVARGSVRRENGYLAPDPAASTVQADTAGRRVVAEALEQVFDADPWAMVRAAVLWLEIDEADRAAETVACASQTPLHPLARRDLWRSLAAAMAGRNPDGHRAAALRLGNAAMEWCDCEAAEVFAGEAHRGLDTPGFEALFLLGRAQLATANLPAARVTFERASCLELAPAELLRLSIHQAEIAYLDGDFPRAAEIARTVGDQTTDRRVALHARNIAGKVLLAQARWREAEDHFAADESDAACEGLEEARLRARTNRAIALLSEGQLQQAERVAESIVEHPAVERTPRAVALALSTLGALAHMQRDYVRALSYYERGIEHCRWLGDSLQIASPSANLAELRLDLGLLEEAEQALLFARKAIPSGLPTASAARFDLIEARVRLETGHTAAADRLVKRARDNALHSRHTELADECLRWAIRVALEDGRTRRAASLLAQARDSSTSVQARADVALLAVLIARADGQDVQAALQQADRLVAVSELPDQVQELGVVSAEIALTEDDLDRARACLAEALAAVERTASALPERLRMSYLSRPQVRHVFAIKHRIDTATFGPCTDDRVSACSQDATDSLSAFVGQHPTVDRLRETVRRIAPSAVTVLLQGESGTGKELVAEAVHYLSDRRGALVKVNCAALAEGLLLSELFGHEKGSFTGAAARRRGRFEIADGGTLFLDEIGDITPAAQIALLRVLQEGTFERVGGTVQLRTSVRVVCASHKDLRQLVDAGRFREDLYYRLSALVVPIPPLRDRKSDIPGLAAHLLQRIAQDTRTAALELSHDAIDCLLAHVWPGNVRELENVLRAAAVFADSHVLDSDAIAPHIKVGAPLSSPQPASGPRAADTCADPDLFAPSHTAYEYVKALGLRLPDLKRTIERDCIQRALSDTGGNITHAARLLGMKRPRLSQLIKEHNLDTERGRS